MIEQPEPVIQVIEQPQPPTEVIEVVQELPMDPPLEPAPVIEYVVD